MLVFRLSVAKHANLLGQGGLFCVGRWHQQGLPIVYTSSSRSLAVLERFIHEQDITIPSLVMMTVFVPDDLVIQRLSVHQLPSGWDTTDAERQTNTQEIGHAFLMRGEAAVMQVPSAIVPHEYNFLINPRHNDATRITCVETHSYFYDERYARFKTR